MTIITHKPVLDLRDISLDRLRADLSSGRPITWEWQGWVKRIPHEVVQNLLLTFDDYTRLPGKHPPVVLDWRDVLGLGQT